MGKGKYNPRNGNTASIIPKERPDVSDAVFRGGTIYRMQGTLEGGIFSGLAYCISQGQGSARFIMRDGSDKECSPICVLTIKTDQVLRSGDTRHFSEYEDFSRYKRSDSPYLHHHQLLKTVGL